MRGPKPQLPTGGTHSHYSHATRSTGKSAGTKSAGTKSHKSSTTHKSKDTYLEGLNLVQRGNEYFFSDCFLEATGYYYQAAMALLPDEHFAQRSKAWSNMAECHLRLQNWQAAEDACNHAIEADTTNRKAFYRRAKARFELADYVGAAEDAEAVGTKDAENVADLCRELAKDSAVQQQQSELSSNITTSRSSLSQTSSAEERDLWFRRIIDSYRLRVDDEYTQTGASDAGSLYGIRAKGGHKPPLDHFKAYVRRALKKRLLPEWFSSANVNVLCQMAIHDEFSNVNRPTMPEEIMEFYQHLGGQEEVQYLRDLATFVEGPIGMPWNDPKVLAEPGSPVSKPRRSRGTPKRMKSREQPPHYTPERRHGSRQYHDPALMDKHSPYASASAPQYPSMRSSKSRGSHHHHQRSRSEYTPVVVQPKYDYNIHGTHHPHARQQMQQQQQQRPYYPYTPVSEKRQQPYYPRTPVSEQREGPPTMPTPSQHSSYEQRVYLAQPPPPYHLPYSQHHHPPHRPPHQHPHQHPNHQGTVEAAWGSFQEDTYQRAPSPPPMSEKTPRSHPSQKSRALNSRNQTRDGDLSGSYGPQLPPYDGRHVVPMMPLAYNGPKAQQYILSNQKYQQQHQQNPYYYDSRNPEEEYEDDRRDVDSHQNVNPREDSSTAREVRNGYSHFSDQVFSDLTELSP